MSTVKYFRHLGSGIRFYRGLVTALWLSMGLWGLLIAGCAQVERHGQTITLQGAITDGTAQELSAVLRPGDTVVLDSDGGYVAPAARMALAIYQAGAKTRIERECASACTLLWYAGRQREATPSARLGLHRSTDHTGNTDKLMATLMHQLGASDHDVALMMATPNTNMSWLIASNTP